MSKVVSLTKTEVNFNLNEAATKFIELIDKVRTVGGFNPILGNRKYFDKDGKCHEAEASTTLKSYIATLVYFCNREVGQKVIRKDDLFEAMDEYMIPTFVENFIVPCSVTVLSLDSTEKATNYRATIKCDDCTLLTATEFNAVTKAIKGALSLGNDPGKDLLSSTSARVISDVKSRVLTPNQFATEMKRDQVYIPISITPFDEDYGYLVSDDHFVKVVEKVITSL